MAGLANSWLPCQNQPGYVRATVRRGSSVPMLVSVGVATSDDGEGDGGCGDDPRERGGESEVAVLRRGRDE